MRLLTCFGCLALSILSMFKFPVVDQLYYFTQIENNMVLASAALQYYLATRPQKSIDFFTFKMAVLLSEFGFAMQLLVALVYWVLLHDELALTNTDWVVHQWRVHIHWFPLFGMALITAFTTNKFDYAHGPYLIKWGFFYIPINAFGTWQRGQPVYPFMPWTDYMSFVIGMGVFITGVILFYISTYILNKLKSRFPQSNKKAV